MWRLRSNLTAYDAAYVAVVEVLDRPLVTLDAALARARGGGRSRRPGGAAGVGTVRSMSAGAGVGRGDGRRSAGGWRRHRASIVVPALALAACGDEEGGSRLLGEPEPTPVEPTQGGTTVTSAADARVGGRAVSVSDVSGLEGLSSALTAGSVVFVPEGQAVRWRPWPGWARRSKLGCATPASRSTNIRDQVIWIIARPTLWLELTCGAAHATAAASGWPGSQTTPTMVSVPSWPGRTRSQGRCGPPPRGRRQSPP
jgi:hypothetical protein